MSGPEAESDPAAVTELFEALDLTGAIETEEFRFFLDHVPIAIAIARTTKGSERLVYANKAFEGLVGATCGEVRGQDWSLLDAFKLESAPNLPLSRALPQRDEFTGVFQREQPAALVEVYSGVIENDDVGKAYHIVALIDITRRETTRRDELTARLRDKDLLLKELQHRVKNNLQLITALIRLEARNHRSGDQVNLERLSGRIEALQLLYKDLEADGVGKVVDLGHYLSQIASAVMHTYAVDGIRLDLKVDCLPTSINIAMPVGLLVNELMTNSFKYAFNGRRGGTITVRCLQDDKVGCRVVVADDGVGLPNGVAWPVPGKLSSLILQSLRENVKTDVSVENAPDAGVRITLDFALPTASQKPN